MLPQDERFAAPRTNTRNAVARPRAAGVVLRIGIALAAGSVVGCGFVQITRTVFPNQAVDTDGNLLFLEDLEDVTQDDDLTPEQQADELAELGIASQELIDAIVENGLSDSPPPANGNLNTNGG